MLCLMSKIFERTREGEKREFGKLYNKQMLRRPSALSGRLKYDGEFDPGSELTLAARIKHASRTVVLPSGGMRVANG